jgi:hypothetical protein
MQLAELVALKEDRDYPSIVVHCGSTSRARDAFEEWRLKDTLAGYIVLTIGAAKNDIALHITPAQALELDLLHLFKIDLARSVPGSFVRILNPGGYIGESTARELAYARSLGLPIVFLEQ